MRKGVFIMKKKVIIIACIAAAAVAIAVPLTITLITNEVAYRDAMVLSAQGDYKAAAEQFDKLGGYSDSAAQKETNLQNIYNEALSDYYEIKVPKKLEEYDTVINQYKKTAQKFGDAGGFSDANEYKKECSNKSAAYSKLKGIAAYIIYAFESDDNLSNAIKKYHDSISEIKDAGINVTFDSLLKEYFPDRSDIYMDYKNDLRNIAGTYINDGSDGQKRSKLEITVDEDDWMISFKVFDKEHCFTYPFSPKIYKFKQYLPLTYKPDEEDGEDYLTISEDRSSIECYFTGNTHYKDDGWMGAGLYFDSLKGTFYKYQ